MTTINTIEQKISEMGGGEFQKLCDAYLSKIGYGSPNSFGSVSGANKVKRGTPDSYFEHENGKFVFAEYTTQQSGLYKKLEGDLQKCLDEEKTNVPVSEIEEIVMCYTGILEPSALLALKTQCGEKEIKLKSFSLSAMANGLLNHPLLIRKFLKLPIDTGQIIPLDFFPSVYGKSKFSTSLETTFLFREDELAKVTNALDKLDLIVVTGKAGVGKSRFALEVCRNFLLKAPEYEAFSIVSQSQNLFDDLQERFSSSGYFLILVDDANRVINFSYFMHLLRNQHDNQQIKIIVTVRDYALSKIENDIDIYPSLSIKLDGFDDTQIKELAQKEFGILNPLYLERIVKISRGNPRIAVMASKLAIEKNTLDSISDVSALYDQYFNSIKQDLQNLDDKNLLKTAGIVAFLRDIDSSNEEMMSHIQSSFDISPKLFWGYILRLNQLEIVDVYENEVVRISDQVLSTYLFYLAFFKEGSINFSDLIQNYFPSFQEKISDALVPCFNSFDRNAIFQSIRPEILILWKNLQEAKDLENLLILANSFWYLLPTEALSLIKKQVLSTEFSQVEFSQIDFPKLANLDRNKIDNIPLKIELQILKKFYYVEFGFSKIAIEILFDYLTHCPSEMLPVLNVLLDGYGFDRFIELRGASTQQFIIDTLSERLVFGRNKLFSQVFLIVGEEFLKTKYQSFETGDKNTFNIYTLNLPHSPDIVQLRHSILKTLTDLYKLDVYEADVFQILSKYANNYHEISQSELVAQDSLILLPFIEEQLDVRKYKHCILVHDYLYFLENHNIDFNVSLREKFQNNDYEIYKLVSENRNERRNYEYEEWKSVKKERILSYFANTSQQKVIHFIETCIRIGKEIEFRNNYEFTSGCNLSMDILAKGYPDLFVLALKHYLELGDLLRLREHPLISNLTKIIGADETIKYLNSIQIETKTKWLFGYYEILSDEETHPNDLPILYNFSFR